MAENRKQPRRSLMSYSQVVDLYGAQRIGYLADINLLGAMVIGDKSMAVDNALTLQIEVPDLSGVTDKHLTLPARVVWCQPDLSPEFFNIGFEFKVVLPAQKKVIQALIETYEFRREPPKYPFRAATK
ncbi:MAG TPA: PilZ domain-containing protein [Anaerolineales bacterium]|jgi:hypothetical protein